MVSCRALVVAKASGADTDSTNRTGTTTHLQKMVCGMPGCLYLCILTVIMFCSYCRLVLSGIVQCGQCRKWSHNTCVGRPAIQNEGQLADWTCEKCDMPLVLRLERQLALNCRPRRGRGCVEEPRREQEDESDGILQMQGARQSKRQKCSKQSYP